MMNFSTPLRYVAIEGYDATGKSTVVQILSSRLNIPLIVEPSDRFRSLTELSDISNRSKLLAYLFDRSCTQDAMPDKVIADRSLLSSMVYNSSFISPQRILETHIELGFRLPSHIILLYSSPATIQARLAARGEEMPAISVIEDYQRSYQQALRIVSRHCKVATVTNYGDIDTTVSDVLLALERM